jgi:hypothetical protein
MARLSILVLFLLCCPLVAAASAPEAKVCVATNPPELSIDQLIKRFILLGQRRELLTKLGDFEGASRAKAEASRISNVILQKMSDQRGPCLQSPPVAGK